MKIKINKGLYSFPLSTWKLVIPALVEKSGCGSWLHHLIATDLE